MNPAEVLTPEARILDLVKKLGMPAGEAHKQIKAAYESEGRQGVESLAQRLQRRYKRACSQLDRTLQERWKDEQAKQAEERYAGYRSEGDQHRRRERERQTLGQRLDDVLIQLERQSSVSAAKVGHQSPSVDSHMPALRQEIERDTFYRRALLLVRSAESAHDRVGLKAVNTQETTEEKNTRLIRDYEGISSWEVVSFDPSMGSHPGSVERIRREHGRRGKDGRMEERRAA